MINRNVSKNSIHRDEISKKYDNLLKSKNDKIEKSHIEDAKRIRSNFKGEKLEDKLNNLFRPYYIKNQEKIVKKINKMFKDNDYDMKL